MNVQVFWLLQCNFVFNVLNQILDEGQAVAQIENQITQLVEKTIQSRKDNNKKSIEKIMLRISSTGLLALARNEVFASTQTVFQNDDAEEESIDGSDADDDDKRRSLSDPLAKTYVPTVGFDEPFFTVPGSYLIQVIGRALTGAAFASSEVLNLKYPTISCDTDTWRRLYQEYFNTHHPASSGSILQPSALKYRLSKFLRSAKTELSCLEDDLELDTLLDTFKVIVSDDISRNAGSINVISDDINEAVAESYTAIDNVLTQRKKDWNLIIQLRLSILLAKLIGFGFQTWGRNKADWPTDVDLLTGVPTPYYMGILGRSLIYSLFSVDDFRAFEEYKKPECGSQDLFNVLRKPEFISLMNGELSGMNRELATVNFKKELKSSVSCLTSVPDQFYDLDIIGTNKAVKVLDDKIQDIIDIVQNI